MPLPEDGERLKELLSRCTVRVQLDSGHGTGFFVAPGVILTSFHVVQNAIAGNAAVTATTFDNRTLNASIREDGYRGPGGPDIALLDVEVDDLPTVIFDLDPVPGEARLVTGGYPSDSAVPYQTRLLRSGGEQNYELDRDGERRPSLRLLDEQVIGGMSGSPVLNIETGFVAGIIRLTLDDRYPLGGFATPMSSVLRELPALRTAFVRPGPTAKEWTALLGPVHLKKFNRDHDGTRWDAEERVSSRVDLNLQREDDPESPLSEWRVAIPSAKISVRLGSRIGSGGFRHGGRASLVAAPDVREQDRGAAPRKHALPRAASTGD